MNRLRSNIRRAGAYVAELAKIAWKAIRPIVVEVALIVAVDVVDKFIKQQARPA